MSTKTTTQNQSMSTCLKTNKECKQEIVWCHEVAKWIDRISDQYINTGHTASINLIYGGICPKIMLTVRKSSIST